MELFLIPVLLFTGVTLIFLGAHGVPSMPSTLRVPAMGSAENQRNDAIVKARIAGFSTPPKPPAPAQTKFGQSDALLGQLLTEMSTVRSELKDLRTQLAVLSVESPAAPAAQPRKRAASRRAVTA